MDPFLERFPSTRSLRCIHLVLDTGCWQNPGAELEHHSKKEWNSQGSVTPLRSPLNFFLFFWELCHNNACQNKPVMTVFHIPRYSGLLWRAIRHVELIWKTQKALFPQFGDFLILTKPKNTNSDENGTPKKKVFAEPMQCSTNWAFKPTESRSLCEFVIYPKKTKIFNSIKMSDTKRPSQLCTQPQNIKNVILIMTSSIAVPVDKRYSHGIMLLIYIFLMFIKTIKKSNYKGTQVWEDAVCNKMPRIRLTGFAWASISNIYWSSRILTKVWRHFFFYFTSAFLSIPWLKNWAGTQ